MKAARSNLSDEPVKPDFTGITALRSSTRIPRYWAIHEAGHAVASWATQRQQGRHSPHFDRVLVRTPDEIAQGPYIDDRGRENYCTGIVEGPSRWNPLGICIPEKLPDTAVIMLEAMMAEGVELCAGPLAEAKFSKLGQNFVWWRGGKDDLERVNLIARDFARNDAERDAIVSECIRRAKRLLAQPPVWTAINLLTDALLDRHCLEADDAIAIINPIMSYITESIGA